MEAQTAPMNKDDVIQSSQKFAESVVQRIMQLMNLPGELTDDLMAAANLGLIEAANKFNFEYGSSFQSFAYLRIRGAVIDALRQLSSLSRKSYLYAKALEAVHDLRETADELATVSRPPLSTEETLAKVFEFAAEGALAYRLTLEEVEEEASEQANPWQNIEDEFAKKENSLQLRKIVETLPLRERTIIEGYYFQDKSFVEIGESCGGMSKSSVSKLHSRALGMVRKRYLEELRNENCD